MAAFACFTPRETRAAACCGSGQSVALRLGPVETSAVGVFATAQDVRGHWNASGRYVDGGDARDRELRFEARALTKIGRSIQVGAIVPYVRTERRYGDLHGVGSGFGDVTLLSRYDFVRVGGENGLPGIALTFGLTLPTGRSPERARHALGTDVTGTGTFEARPGIVVEKIWWNGWFVIGAASVGFLGPSRRADGGSVALGPRFLSLLAAGKGFTNGFSFALGGTHEQEAAPRADGLRVGANRARTSALAFVGYELDDNWQVLATVLVDVIGREQLAGTTIGLGIRRAWNVY